MRKSFPVLSIFILASVSNGCGGPLQVAQSHVVQGPHGGTMTRLDNDKGFVELVNEPEVADRRNPQPTSIVAYFLGPDGKTPLSPAPAEVSFQITPDARSRQRAASKAEAPLPLAAEPKSGDPSGDSRFVSKPGPYDLSGTRGVLNAKMDGNEASIQFQGAR